MLDRLPQHGLSPGTVAASFRVARCTAALVGVIGVSALFGWAIHSERLVHWAEWAGWEMPNSALILTIAAASLGLRIGDALLPWRQRAGEALAGAVLAVATIIAFQHATGMDLGIDQLLVVLGPPTADDPHPGRLGEGATIGLLLSGVSLLVLRTRGFTALCVSSLCTATMLLLSLTALFGYAFNVSDDSPFWSVLDMSIQTSIALLALGAGMMAARPDRPAIRTLISAHAGSVLARRVMSVGIGLPILLAVIHFIGVRSDRITEAAGMAMLMTVVIGSLSAVVLVTAGALNRADDRRRLAEESQRRMLHELDHRVKNTLATVLAVCDQTLEGAATPEDFRSAFRGRLTAIARAHEALAANRWHGVKLREVVEATVAPFVHPGSGRLRVIGEHVLLPAAAALPVAVTLHELATNAVKHGALSRPAGPGVVTVRWCIGTGGKLIIDWEETGGPPVRTAAAAHARADPADDSASPDRPTPAGGFGTSLIRGLIAFELHGATDLELEVDGVRCRMTVPLRAVVAAAAAATTLSE